MTDAYVLHERPELESPVLVVCLHGWIDVGAGGASAMEVLESEVAEAPPAPTSIQPWRQTTSTGDSSSGRSCST